MTRSAREVVRLMRDAGVPVDGDLVIERTHAGRHQRSAGAWSWYAVDTHGSVVVASQWPIGELVKAGTVTASPNPSRETLVLWPVLSADKVPDEALRTAR